MRINNHKLGDIVYHDQFFEYFNQLRGALNIQPDDNAILRGLQLSQSGTNVNVSAGWATGKPVFISFIKNNLGDIIRPCEEAVATGIALPDPFNGFVFLRFVMSSMVAGAAFYDITTQLVIDTAPTAAFPTGNIIGEVCLGSVSRIGALITISNVGRDFDAAPSGDPVLANSYDASTDSPSLAGMSTPSFYRVGTAGTQVIGGIKYNLKVKDLVFRDSNGYSVVSATRNLNFQNIAYDASTDTPALADLLEGGIYEVIAAGKLTGVTILGGVMVGADSYLLVGDKVVNKNGSYELISPKIKNGTTINVGTGGLFTKFKDANDYISQRVYTGVILNLLSTTVETSSIDVQNPCGGRLVIMGNGFFIDHSGTANTNCTLSGNNIYIDDFKVKANHTTEPALSISGKVTHDNGTNVQQSGAGLGIKVDGGALKVITTADSSVSVSANITAQALAIGSTAFLNLSGDFSCNNLTATNGDVTLGGNSATTWVNGTLNVNNGSCNRSSSSSIVIGGDVTVAGDFNCGNSCSNQFVGAITTSGDFNCGIANKNISIGNISAANFLGANNNTNWFSGNLIVTNSVNLGIACITTIVGSVTATSIDMGNVSASLVFGNISLAGSFTFGDNCRTILAGNLSGVTNLSCGSLCNNEIYGTTTGTGLFDFANSQSSFFNNVTGFTSVSAVSGASVAFNGFTAPVGTPAAGTNTAFFRRTT